MTIRINAPLLLLAVLCTASVFGGTNHHRLAESLSLPTERTAHQLPNNNQQQQQKGGFRETIGGCIGIRPELSKDSYAHRSAVECSSGTIDVKIASEEKGLGAFATSTIPFGTLLGRYNGETFVLSEVEARFWNKANKTAEDLDWEQSRTTRGQSITGHFLFELPNGSFVDAEDADKSSWVRFMNHADPESSECNVKAFIKTMMGDEDEEFPLMYAIADIQAVRWCV